MTAVGVERLGSVLLLEMNRPDRANALGPAVRHGLHEGLARARDDAGIHAVVLTGSGSTFSAGGDFKEDFTRVLSGGQHEVERLIREHFALFLAIEQFPKPVIAAVNGHALAGGAELVLACDLAFACPTATFGLPEPRSLGTPAGFALLRLADRIGDKAARALLLGGQKISASEAAGLGLINRVTDASEDVLDAALSVASSFAACAPLAVSSTKRYLFDRQEPARVDEVIALLVRLFDTEDVHEAVEAFTAKRPPVFAGR